MLTVSSIIVTYHPKPDELAPLLERLLLQTGRVILVDNTPGHENSTLTRLCRESSAPERCITIRFGETLSIKRKKNIYVNFNTARRANEAAVSTSPLSSCA